MRVLWISCLLIGSVTCTPVPKDQSSTGGAPPTWWSPPWTWVKGPVGVDSGSNPTLPKPGSGQAGRVPVGYSSVSDLYNRGNVGEGDWFQSGSDGGSSTGGGSQAGQSGASGGSGSAVGSVYMPQGPAGGGESSEQFFSAVSDLVPVFSSHGRSRYQRGSAHFAQTRYTPTERLYYYPDQVLDQVPQDPIKMVS